MKYRIKQEVYRDGSIKYYAQYYKGFFSGWKSLFSNGEKAVSLYNVSCGSREECLTAIHLCEKGKNLVISITYEYK